jgi:hypothetical protein
MTIKLRLVDNPNDTEEEPQVGDVWRAPLLDKTWIQGGVEVSRLGWAIMLPSNTIWYTTQKASDGQFWEVTGTAEELTVHPSIHVQGQNGWHGWIRNGEIVDA